MNSHEHEDYDREEHAPHRSHQHDEPKGKIISISSIANNTLTSIERGSHKKHHQHQAKHLDED